MKKLYLLLTLLFLLVVQAAQAQKFGYLDMEYLMGKMPEYQTAKAEMNKWTERWTKDIADKYAELEKLERAYRNEEVLLTDAMKQERQKAIADKEKEVKDFNSKVFGFEGLLYQKKAEIIKPLMDQIDKAVQKVARQKQLMFLFDKSSEGTTMVYTDPRHDYTDYVMEELGIKTDLNKEKENQTQAADKPPVPNNPTPNTPSKRQTKN
ncbi:MAG: OmpH family outer membrane protein [Spirosomataceae bacterium]